MSDTVPFSRPASGGDRGRDLKTGRVLDGRYEILERVGAGGMGVVYKARRLVLGDTVAVKLLAPLEGSRDDPSRFLLEARAAAHIRHPNVVEIFDFGNPPDGDPYIVMEYLDGPTLAERLHDGPLEVTRALEVLAPICAAVEAGHRRGVIHRDLKPANIILNTSDDGREVVKVLDFGLARFDADKPRLTKSGAIVGTAKYMSPEQANGREAVPASDVFTLGILLYEMVAGRVPFLGKTPVMTALAIARGSYDPVDAVVSGLPRQLIDAIDQALQQDPSRRPETPEQLARLAEAALPRPAARPRSRAASRPGDGRSGAGAAFAAAVPAFDHFVGRERQLRRLEEEFQKSIGGSGRVVVVVGEAGIGKTRLIERFLEQLGVASGSGTAPGTEAMDRAPKTGVSRTAVVLRGRFFDYEGSRPPPFESFLDMLRSASGAPHSLAPEALETDPALEVEGRRWRAFTALTEAFAARAGTSPLILVLDDVHWATGADLDLINHLHRSLAHRGTLVLVTAREQETLGVRPSLRGRAPRTEGLGQKLEPQARVSGAGSELSRWLERLAARRAHAVLALRPFGEQEVREWFERGFGEIRIRPRDLKRIARATGANPYCLVEVARHLLDTGAIDWQQGWSCQPLTEVELPETVVSLVRARLAGLDPALRELLETASVIGDELRLETLRLASGLTAGTVEGLVDDATGLLLLSDRGVSRGNDLRFANETLRRVLYRDMSRRRRRRAHRRVVTALEALYRDDLDRLAPVLAYHHHAVGDWGDALSWGIRALSEALDRSDNDLAEEMLARAQDAAASATSVAAADRHRLDYLAGCLYRRLGRLDDATGVLRSAEGAGDDSLGAAARLELARCHLDRGDLEAALQTARAARRSARQLGERRRELEARMFEASCLLRLGLNQETAGMLERLLADLDDSDPRSIHALAHRERAWALLKSGAFDQAQVHAQRALQLAREAGDLLTQHHALSALAVVLGESGDNVGSLPYHRRALELARRLSLRRREAIDLANLGEVFYEACDPDQALDHFRQALAIFVEIGDRACEGDCRVNVGRAMLARGDVTGALAMLERGRTLCETIGRTEYAGIASLQEGEAHLRRGNAEAASEAFARAQDRFAQIDAHHLWRAHFGRARAERAAGRPQPALEFARLAADRVAAQRAQLPAEADNRGFDRAASGVFELLEGLEAGGRHSSGAGSDAGTRIRVTRGGSSE